MEIIGVDKELKSVKLCESSKSTKSKIKGNILTHNTVHSHIT